MWPHYALWKSDSEGMLGPVERDQLHEKGSGVQGVWRGTFVQGVWSKECGEGRTIQLCKECARSVERGELYNWDIEKDLQLSNGSEDELQLAHVPFRAKPTRCLSPV